MAATKKSQSKSGKKKVSAAYKQKKALELRLAGKTLDEIAADLNYADASGAYKAILAGLRHTLQEPADELRKIEFARLEKLWDKVWGRLSMPGPLPTSDLSALVRSLLKIMDRRARLVGLDTPMKLDLSWRQEAEDAGLPASEIFERMVKEATLAIEDEN